MRGSIGETLERLILLQIGAAAATRDRVEEIVERLIAQGRVQREEGRTVVDDVMSSARQRTAGARSAVDASMQQGLRTAGIPTREDYEDLIFRVEQLEHRVRMLEDRPGGTPVSSAATSATSSPSSGGTGGVTGPGGPSGMREPGKEPGTSGEDDDSGRGPGLPTAGL
ncbi:Hypothetical Protein RradSPS_1330 [Rubrobacter radiotolerans]|uniref:Polyhydroxyalkanoate synthesis regulator phasin n=1 Tax=Rubrobacter radiotolerans TaxID=42256 RepID=A0A023X2R8_RUBRA|nr:hypothetical protein [Rubrobacter radiotolerans]AHY46613.1 Hypothetical Protein RradSPS_1330 [Rubrobacter radiotolerans]MDX5894020.1 hypothetical protein [Rubrobacter radiotolerans]SMC04993.1 Polyhydroxyalkanoate synthesis regulator phasin [Rubrobacter radiotolerans DSM 5868]